MNLLFLSQTALTKLVLGNPKEQISEIYAWLFITDLNLKRVFAKLNIIIFSYLFTFEKIKWEITMISFAYIFVNILLVSFLFDSKLFNLIGYFFFLILDWLMSGFSLQKWIISLVVFRNLGILWIYTHSAHVKFFTGMINWFLGTHKLNSQLITLWEKLGREGSAFLEGPRFMGSYERGLMHLYAS